GGPVCPNSAVPLGRTETGPDSPDRYKQLDQHTLDGFGTLTNHRADTQHRAAAPGARIVVASAEQCCGSQAMRSIVWAQPAALPLREGAPLQGGASFPQVL